jgi:hypothetical protein
MLPVSLISFAAAAKFPPVGADWNGAAAATVARSTKLAAQVSEMKAPSKSAKAPTTRII